MHKTITKTHLYDLIRNKVGEIYVARKGTVVVFIIGNDSYMVNCNEKTTIVVNPEPNYWARAIDWAGGFSDYFTHQMCPPDKLTYDAELITPMRPEYLAKLKTLVVGN